VVKAPTYHLWLLAVLVGEYGILFIGLTILMLLSGFLPGLYLWQGTTLGVLAILLFLYPIVSAYQIGKKLDSDIHQAFPPGKSVSNQPLKPFSIIRLFKPDPKLKYQTFK
jgi:hypothetical protein